MFGAKKWKVISSHFNKIFKDNQKNREDCKHRWYNDLNCCKVTNEWSLIEEYTFFEVQRKVGNKWSHISKFLPGR
jgi:hypothetical protein